MATGHDERQGIALHEQVHGLADQLDARLFLVSQHGSAKHGLSMDLTKAKFCLPMLEKLSYRRGPRFMSETRRAMILLFPRVRRPAADRDDPIRLGQHDDR